MNKSSFIQVLVVILVLVGLFLVFKPQSSSTTNTQTQATPSAQISSKTFNLEVKNKKLIGDNTLKATEGDQVTINITVDEDEELHLHGYDKSADLTANKPASLTFTANLTGRFPYELEKSKTEIGALEVSPK